MVLNSIMRASFRRSSFFLQRKPYVWPSLPTNVIFFGCCSDRITSYWGPNPRWGFSVQKFYNAKHINWPVMTGKSFGNGPPYCSTGVFSGKTGCRAFWVGTHNSRLESLSSEGNLLIDKEPVRSRLICSAASSLRHFVNFRACYTMRKMKAGNYMHGTITLLAWITTTIKSSFWVWARVLFSRFAHRSLSASILDSLDGNSAQIAVLG